MNKVSEWYWSKGLHDAKIRNISYVNLSYDYTQKKPIRNVLTIQLDSQKALFETSIKEIKLYNAKILTQEDDYIGWWISDNLTLKNDKYFLEISIMTVTQKKQLNIMFETAEIIR